MTRWEKQGARESDHTKIGERVTSANFKKLAARQMRTHLHLNAFRLQNVRSLERHDRKFRACSQVNRTRHLCFHATFHGKGARARKEKAKKGTGKNKGPKGKGKDTAKSKQTKNRKLGPCHWCGRDGHCVADCCFKQWYERVRRPTVAPTSAKLKTTRALHSRIRVRVDDKDLRHQQNNVTQKAGILVWFPGSPS